MKKGILRHWYSLRTRITLSVLVMILPAAILMFSAYKFIRSGSDTLIEMVDAPFEALIKNQEVQTKIFQIELPFHLYLNRGDSSDRETFVRSSVDIDMLFENALKQNNLSQQNAEILRLAQNEWAEAKLRGERLLTTSNIPDQDTLIEKIDQFSRHLEKSYSLLEEINFNIRLDIKSQRVTAQENEWKSIAALSLVFALGVVLAILAALSLGQSVIEPIRRLEKTVNRFGQGETATRINLHSNDELEGLASAFNTLAERYEHIKHELDYLSVHDNLTGLYDRTKLQEEIISEINRAERYDRPFSLLLIDINNFTKVNQAYGRLVGDSVLCSVANKICATVRPTDVSSRYGGDEFAVILSETDGKGAAETMRRIIDVIEKNPLNLGDGKQLAISMTIICASYPADAETEVALFAYADKALFNAKMKARQRA
ncbi:MAG TPA: sensor domain-containing diguanylate cyclase [Gammaproteobacteria bacterium]|nr:sensor domain-containing diguanylate cyclase [Gammaproteobacteria bacterium]